jgi:hypothetical protein
MKSAYELAMERLNKASPTVKTSTAQKKALAELDSKYAAKIAECELTLKDQISRAVSSGEIEKAQQLEEQLVLERRKLQAELEEKKDAVRNGGGRK